MYPESHKLALSYYRLLTPFAIVLAVFIGAMNEQEPVNWLAAVSLSIGLVLVVAVCFKMLVDIHRLGG